MTVFALRLAPLSSSTSMQAARLRRRHQLFGALQVHDVDVIVLDMAFQRGGELRPFGVRHRDEILDPHRIEHLAAETLGRDAGADALARGIDRRCRAGRAAADDSTSNGSFARSFRRALQPRRCRAWRRSAPAPCGPEPNGSPFRNTVGTAITLRASTSSWNSAPSIATWRMRGLSTPSG
jgi:hypothetical protein